MTCRGAHWFAYPGMVGTSAPTCTRYACEAPNPRYDRDRDPKATPPDAKPVYTRPVAASDGHQTRQETHPMTKTVMTVPASEVQEGDFLPGLGNGYVFEDAESASGKVSMSDGRYSFDVGEGMTLVSFHTAEGDEAFLVVPEDMPVTVERAE